MKTIPLKIEIPTSIYLTRKTKDDRRVSLNLNIYRNLHHSVNNQAKQKFKKDMLDLFKFKCIPVYGVSPMFDACKITYTIYNPTKRKLDIMNVGSIIDKFFSDALVYFNIIEDDSFEFLKEVHFIYGGYRKDCSFAIAEIEALQDGEFK